MLPTPIVIVIVVHRMKSPSVSATRPVMGQDGWDPLGVVVVVAVTVGLCKNKVGVVNR